MAFDFEKGMANPLTSLGLSLVANTQNPGQAIQQGLQQGLAMKKQFDEENANKALSKAVMSGADPQEALSIYAEAGGDPMKGAQFINSLNKQNYDKYKTVGRSLIDLDTGKPVYTAPADSGDVPSNVREWQFYNAMPPEKQAAYREMKRAQQVIDLGGEKAILGAGGDISKTYPMTPKPQDMPGFKQQQEAAKAMGKGQGEATMQLPDTIAKADYADKLLTDLLNAPGLEASVGLKQPQAYANFGQPIAGTEAADFSTRLDQIKGQQFLQAFETLKGGGQITEVEGKKATDAISRMNTAQSEPEFKAAAQELQAIIRAGKQRALQKAGSMPPSSAQPASGNIVDWNELP